jgi:hypothetical protein
MVKLVFPRPFIHKHPSMEVPQETYEKRHTAGQKAAEVVANTVGSWTYVIVQSAVILLWYLLNITAWLYQKMEQEIHVIMDHLDAQNAALQLIYDQVDAPKRGGEDRSASAGK